ncbi:putative pyruvyl transferase EpsO [compost metagenome]
MAKGISFINKYDKVVTTRLHGLILSILLNKEVYMLDNSYGKCKRFHDVWLKDFTGIELLKDKVIE